MGRKTIGFVIPAYNPVLKWASNVEKRLSEIKALLKDADFDIILVISPDGSKRGHSQDEINVFRQSSVIKDLIHLEIGENKGKGHAVRMGLRSCNADYYIYTDWDFPFTNESYVDVINWLLRDDIDIVLPFRKNYISHLSWFRHILSRLSQIANKFLFMLPSSDTQAGLKGFNNDGKAVMLSTTLDTYLFDTEFIVMSVKRRLRVKVVDVDIRDGILLSSMKIKVVFVETVNIFKILYRRWFC